MFKKIIEWIKKIFNRLFGKKKITKRIKKNFQNNHNKRYLKGYGVMIEDSLSTSMPIYLMIPGEEREKTIQKLKQIEYKIQDLDKSEELTKIKSIIQRIEDNTISVYQNEKINTEIDRLLSNKTIFDNYILEKKDILKESTDFECIIKTIDDSLTKIDEITNSLDYNIKDKLQENGEKINYLTITSLILDETAEEIKKIEDDYKHHRYNKYYYNRELERIKERINSLIKIRDSEEVRLEILDLRNDIFYKSKDRYDLLYNEEAFLNIQTECDILLKKVNKRVIDIKRDNIEKNKERSDNKKDAKKENKKERKEETKDVEEKEQEFYESILKRFQDVELARQLILLKMSNSMHLNTKDELLLNIERIYFDFLNGEKAIFNYQRNKVKTELVEFYNSVNCLNCLLNDEEYISVDHINFKMSDLISAAIIKKECLEETLINKYNYQRDKHQANILVDNKLNLLLEEEEKKIGSHILVKRNIKEKK